MAFNLNKKQYTDPVCGMKVNPAKAAAMTIYKGDQLYFCAESCKITFDADPKKFAKNQPKSFWHRYLDKLNKATGGRPPSCCS
ncbi:MAG: YHS domain-containing protein [Desulfobacterales bacterium]|jgi:Cu+-exporting ATPase